MACWKESGRCLVLATRMSASTMQPVGTGNARKLTRSWTYDAFTRRRRHPHPLPRSLADPELLVNGCSAPCTK